MPMPKPQPTETKPEFIRRCMGNQTMVDDYDDNGQRFAICQSLWSDKEDGTSGTTLETLQD